MIDLRWTEMGKRVVAALPWWAGPWRRTRWGPDVYWQPVSKVVTDRLNRAYDVEAWLMGQRVGSVLITLNRPGLMWGEPPGVLVADDSVVADLVVSDELACSRDLPEVLDQVEAEAMRVLRRVIGKLGLPPITRRAEPLAEEPVALDRIGRIGAEFPGPIALVAPHLARRTFADAIAGAEIDHGFRGWRMIRLTGAGEMPVDVDFRAIDAPMTLANLTHDKTNALIVVGERVGTLPEGLTPLVAGRDQGRCWVAFGFTRPSGRPPAP